MVAILFSCGFTATLDFLGSFQAFYVVLICSWAGIFLKPANVAYI